MYLQCWPCHRFGRWTGKRGRVLVETDPSHIRWLAVRSQATTSQKLLRVLGLENCHGVTTLGVSIEVFCDAYLASCKRMAKSTIGIVVQWNGQHLAKFSATQDRVALSTAGRHLLSKHVEVRGHQQYHSSIEIRLERFRCCTPQIGDRKRLRHVHSQYLYHQQLVKGESAHCR